MTADPISFTLKEEQESQIMHIDIAPETERLVREEIDSGHFRSVDEMINVAVETWRERNADARSISEIILDNMKDVPRAEFGQLPKDGASQHDHYLYGHPRRDQ